MWIAQLEEFYHALSLEIPPEFRSRKELLLMRAEIYASIGFSPSCVALMEGKESGASKELDAVEQTASDEALLSDVRSTPAMTVKTLKGAGKVSKKTSAGGTSTSGTNDKVDHTDTQTQSGTPSSPRPIAGTSAALTTPKDNNKDAVCCQDSILGTPNGCLATSFTKGHPAPILIY